MKLKRILALGVMLLLLTGCYSSGGGEMNQALALRTKLLKAACCTFQAEVSADFGEKCYAFTMDCTADDKGNVTFCVTAPESIADITGEISAQAGKLTFDGTALDFGLLADGRLSPVSAPWVLMKALRSGCITGAGTDGDSLCLNISDSFAEDALKLDIWLGKDGLPRKADISSAGVRILSLSVENMAVL